MFNREYRSSTNARLETLLLDLSENRIDAVDLSNMLLTDHQLERLWQAINESEKVKRVYLSNCAIGSHGAAIIAQYLRVNKSVTKLDLDYNRINASGFAFIADALVSPGLFHTNYANLQASQSNISALVLSHDDANCPEAWDHHVTGFNKTLKILSINQNHLADPSLAVIERLMLGNESLTHLSLTGNPMKMATIAAIENAWKLKHGSSELAEPEESAAFSPPRAR